MSESLLALSVSDKRFQSRPVIDRVDFRIRPGEIVSLLGPSGVRQEHAATHRRRAG